MSEHTHERFRFATLSDFSSVVENMDIDLPLSESTRPLTQPLSVCGTVISNRLAVQPMEGCDGTFDGRPGDLTYRRYGRFARGGAGLIWFEATAVVYEGRANPRQLVLVENNLKAMKELLDRTVRDAVNTYGSDRKPFTVLQLTHSGRYSRPESESRPVIAVKNPHLDSTLHSTPRLIGDDELEELEDRFADAAAMACEIGFDAVDIKSCHGYLISELLSSRSRGGRYGGSYENRTRFLVNVIEKIRSRTHNNLVLAPRLSVYDGIPYPYGWGVARNDHKKCDPDEPIRLVERLHDRGIELINLTAGNPYYNPHINRPYDTGPYVPLEHPLAGVARMLKTCRDINRAVPGMTIVATGFSWLREFGANVAARGIEKGWFAVAGFGREALAYPDFPKDLITNGAMKREKCCITCGKCSELMRLGSTAGCVMRDRDVYLPIYREASAGKSSLAGTHTAEHV